MAGLFGWIRRFVSSGQEGERDTFTPDMNYVRQGAADPESLTLFAEHHNDFALALYGQLRGQPGNLQFSPFSIRAALGMAYAGAKGETAAQMSRALCFPFLDDDQDGSVAEIIQRLEAGGGGDYEIAMANSLWCQEFAPILAGFRDRVARHCGGSIDVLDFRGHAEDACLTINGWVEDKTKQRIRELVPSGALNARTRLVLANAVYFTGAWVLPFPQAATRDEPFNLEGGGTVQAPLMHHEVEVRYLQDPDYQAVDLEYRGGELSMLVLLPDENHALENLETRLSARMLHDCVARLTMREVNLFLPRFSTTGGVVELNAQLGALGMKLAFLPFQADFSGINGVEPPHDDSLFISDVLHKSFVEVNEEGTRAAAATAIVMFLFFGAREPLPVPIFRADRPFLFAIRDRKSGAILFLGRVVDPTRKS